METIRDLLQEKERRPLCATFPGSSVLDATRLMNAERIGALLVMEERQVVGIFTERDVLQRVVAEGRSPSATPVAAVMTTEVVCCGPETPVDEVAEMMRRERIRHVPVVAGDAVVGMVSIGDINAHRFNHCEAALHQVEDYIHRRA
jgi:CBS domain-containing protein